MHVSCMCMSHICTYTCIYIHMCVCLKPSVILRKTNMRAVNKWLVIHFLLLLSTYSQKSDGVLAEWCIADEQTPDSELQVGLDWACGRGGANCSKIQVGQACFRPNTVRAHASYAFNNYYQKLKYRGGTCYFKGAAITTDLDPSYNSCNYEVTP